MCKPKRNKSDDNVTFMAVTILAVAIVLQPQGLAAQEPSPSTPFNVVFIVADDLGWTDLGCCGSTFYETPHLDRLAEEGVRFTSAYAACPVCSPTRASLLTGRYPQRMGVTDFSGAAQPNQWRRKTPLLPAPYQTSMAVDEVTLAERFKSAGYATLFAGKWHLGSEPHWPEHQGFEFNFGGTSQGGPYGGKQYFSPYENPRLPDGPDGEHLPDRLANETSRFIRANADNPFFAHVCFYSVHTPLIARPDLQAKYEAKAAALPDRGDDAWGTEGERRVRLVHDHAVYAGMVEAMDLAVGKILTAVDEAGLAEHTWIIFTSDNGGLSTSEGHPTSNLPLRAGKGWLYEGGIRVPLIIRPPAALQQQNSPKHIDQYVSSIDYFPTLIEGCEIADDPNQPLVDGVSIVPLLNGETIDRGPIFWHYPHYGNQGGSPSAAVRDGNWKLIEWFGSDRVELYRLDADLGEQVNLIDQYPEFAGSLQKKLHAWQADIGAKFPTPNPGYDVGH